MSSVDTPAASHAALMDGVYRRQRHIYDLTRKYYLLGRDRLIAGLNAPADSAVLELGCGTGRNLVRAARRFPSTHLFGLDISAQMLTSAQQSIERNGLSGRVLLAQGDATNFDTNALFGIGSFDRIFVSYSLSMIPGWERTVAAALAALCPGGSLHIVDFGRQEGLPRWFRRLLRLWLAKFQVTPRDSLRQVLESEAERSGASLYFETLYLGYASLAIMTRSVAPLTAADAPWQAGQPPVSVAGN
ncbi:class I SAM-dependent methyltransferase [Mesorhizobium sp. Root157]|uniref:class I SAM-dependent methyltransferase n=1 Tax=Mesorhizobium sp. Root157 TaxID=1736477 RepID=UPI0009E710BF|nr:class I SAM-dependent methyltransferase [Mesorhizobium sp. Root157]